MAEDVAVVGLDHQPFEIDCIFDVVGNKRLQRLSVVIGAVAMPEQDGKIAVDPVKRAAVHAELLLAALQPALEAETRQDIAQIDLRLTEPDPEISLKKRDIEAFAVVADDHLVLHDVIDKIFQVDAIDVGENLPAIIEGDGGYLGAVIKAGSLDIKVDGFLPEMGKNPPGFGAGEIAW